ncbi:MAG TPA: histidine phosphatase family protein [Rhizomicrobium sp.]|nr:histidine phosphatase family protein [Rhizomicrobium sp.]
MRLAFLRHGPTDWNAQDRIQGRIDMPLSEAGRALMAGLLPPDGFEAARAFTSPLGRARETAALLGYAGAIPDARLSEHHWGAWEGLTRAEILARDGADAFAHAGSGIDFTPKDGESTRALLARVADFIRDVAGAPGDAVAIAHRGILRSAYTLATGWDMATAMPAKLDLSAALILEVEAGGTPRIAALNVPLKPRTAPACGTRARS